MELFVHFGGYIIDLVREAFYPVINHFRSNLSLLNRKKCWQRTLKCLFIDVFNLLGFVAFLIKLYFCLNDYVHKHNCHIWNEVLSR